MVVNDTTQAEPIAILLDEPLVHHDDLQTETSETAETDEERWFREENTPEAKANSGEIMAHLEKNQQILERTQWRHTTFREIRGDS